MKTFGAFKVSSDRKLGPDGHHQAVGTIIEAPDGMAYALPQFPKRITGVRSVEAGILVSIDGGKRERLLQPQVDSLTEAMCDDDEVAAEAEFLEGLIALGEWS
jgi:hypothetical protein